MGLRAAHGEGTIALAQLRGGPRAADADETLHPLRSHSCLDFNTDQKLTEEWGCPNAYKTPTYPGKVLQSEFGFFNGTKVWLLLGFAATLCEFRSGRNVLDPLIGIGVNYAEYGRGSGGRTS
jgi:hypothetical protein